MTKAVLPSPNVSSNFYYQWKNLFIYFQNDNHRGKIENICIVTWYLLLKINVALKQNSNDDESNYKLYECNYMSQNKMFSQCFSYLSNTERRRVSWSDEYSAWEWNEDHSIVLQGCAMFLLCKTWIVNL